MGLHSLNQGSDHRDIILILTREHRPNKELQVPSISIARLPDCLIRKKRQMTWRKFHDKSRFHVLITKQLHYMMNLVLSHFFFLHTHVYQSAFLELIQDPTTAVQLSFIIIQTAKIYKITAEITILSMSWIRSGRSRATIWRSLSVNRWSSR